MKESKIHVAIIDSGVKEEFIDINLLHNIEINNELLISLKSSNDEIMDNHGTVCAAIIKLYASKVDISSVKILNNYKSNVNQLYAALKWCVQHNVKVINMSLGSYNFNDFDEMRKVVNYIHSKGIIMVCASQNGEFITYPASFSNVIGVKCDRGNLLSKGEYFFNTNFEDGIEITAFSKHILPENLEITGVCENSNSFAAPMITAMVCNIIYNMPDYSLEDIKNRLREGSKNYSSKEEFKLLYRSPDWIKKAMIFSVKENIHSKAPCFFEIIEEISILDNEICDVISKQLYEEKDNVVDTIIIIISNLNLERISQISYLAEQYSKNIVFIDDHIDTIPKDNISKYIKTWHGNLIWNEIKKHIGNKIRIADIPIVFMYFHEDIDGCYFLYTLKKHFFKNGYNAFTAIEKSEGILYDIEYIPLKYMKNKCEQIQTYMASQADKMNSDIIICGVSLEEKCELDDLRSKFDIDLEIMVQIKEQRIKINILENESCKLALDNLDYNSIGEVAQYIINILSNEAN